MNDQYLQSLHQWINDQDPSYAGSYDQFKERMKDEKFATQTHLWVSMKDNTFQKRRPLDEFLQTIRGIEPTPAQTPTQATAQTLPVQPGREVKKKEQTQSSPLLQGQPPAMESSLAGFSSASFRGTNKPVRKQVSQDAFARKPQVARDATFVKPATGTLMTQVEQEAIQQKKDLSFIEPFLNTITPTLMERSEEVVVPQLNYQFGNLGFKFEESGMTGDYMTATAPNGQVKEFGLDPFLGIGSKEKAEDLKNWIKKNSIAIPKTSLDKIKETYTIKDKVFASQEDIDKEVKKFTQQASLLKTDIDSYFKDQELLNEEGKAIENIPEDQRNTQEFINRVNNFITKRDELQQRATELEKKQANVSYNQQKLSSSVGKYTSMRSEQGSLIPFFQTGIKEGFADIGKFVFGAVGDMMIEAIPVKMLFSKDKQKNEIVQDAKQKGISGPAAGQDWNKWFDALPDEVRQKYIDAEQDRQKKGVKYGFEEQIARGEKGWMDAIDKGYQEMIGSKDITPEYIQDLNKNSIIARSLYGVSKSLPAMMGGTPQRVIQMFGQVSTSMMEEMQNDPDFKDVSESERWAVAVPVGVASAVLEEVGFRNIVGQKGLLNGFVLRALGKSGATTTAKSFAQFIRQDVNSMMARGVLTLGAAGLAEFETGAAQEIAEVETKRIYNYFKDKRDQDGKFMKMFNTPESGKEYAIQVAKAGIEEAIGGFVLGVPSAVSQAYTKQGFRGMDDETFITFSEMANDEKLQSAFILSLKNKITTGEITSAQAKETLNNYRASVGLFRSLPEGLSLESQKEAMNLLRERRDIEARINGKESSLTKPQQKRIDEINQELNKLSEDAIQEQETNERLLRTEESQVELPTVVEGNAQPEVSTGVVEETVTPKVEEKTIEQRAKDALQEILSMEEVSPIMQNYTRGIQPGQEQQVMDEVLAQVTENEPAAVRQFGQPAVDVIKQYGQPPVAPMEVTEPTAEVTPTAEATQEVSLTTLLEADPKDKTILKKTSDFLGRTIEDLDKFQKESLGVNIALPVMKVIVKAVKALVDAGVSLQEAIARVSADNNVSEQNVVSAMQTIENIEKYAGMELGASEGLSEAELPGYDRMIQEAEAIVADKKRGRKESEMYDAVMGYVQGSLAYINATNVQREQLFRDVRKRFGLKEKQAPSARRITGQTRTKVTVDDLAALKEGLRREARAAREAKKDLNEKRRILGFWIETMASKGKLKTRQVVALTNKISKLNLDNELLVNKFLDYAEKVFKDADYQQKLTDARTARKAISILAKNKDKFGNLRALGKEFLKIDPSMIEDLDAYNEMASKIKESLVGSRSRGTSSFFADMVNVSQASDYVNETLKEQDDKMKKDLAAEIQSLMGIDVSQMSYAQMKEIIGRNEPITKYDEGIIRAAVNNAFSTLSTIINDMIENGVDPFTGDPVSLSAAQKRMMKKFMAMDLNKLDPKEAFRSVDALMNFIQNSSTANMGTVLANYNAITAIERLIGNRVIAYPLQKLYMKTYGRLLAENTTNLGPLFERMFRGVTIGGLVEDLMGLTSLKNGKALAERISNNISAQYVKRFYKRKANGEAFNSEYNNIERGMLAYMMRTVIGNDEQIQAEWIRRKGIVEQSIDVLSKGSEQEQKLADVYQQVYDNVLKNKNDIGELLAVVDVVNMEAIEYWQNEWADKFDDMADISLNIYNTELKRDANFTPDRFARISGSSQNTLAEDDSSFLGNNGGVYRSPSGSLIPVTQADNLPKGKYINLSFDSVNSNAMYDSLIDIKTASAIRQVSAFLANEEGMRKLIPQSEDRELLDQRIKLYVRKIRNKSKYSDDELSQFTKRLNRIAAIGVGQALGGISQAAKQVVPVILNTFINAGTFDLAAAFNKSKNDFINNSGYAVANRGSESITQIENINRILEKSATSNRGKLLSGIERINKFWLDAFLVAPDAFIARASWLAFYEKSLREQGIDTKGLDYSTHELNEEAGNYAQRMLDRQQNISDPDQAGKLFMSEGDTFKTIFTKALMPFASFRMNQSTRLANDLSVLSNFTTSTKEDIAIAARSLGGFAAELVSFKFISGAISVGLGMATNSIMAKLKGEEEDEEKKKEDYEKLVDLATKGQITSSFVDLFSPVPILDNIVQGMGNTLIDLSQAIMKVPEEERVNIYGFKTQDFIKSLGLFGISIQRAEQLGDMLYLANGGSFEDKYGKKKYLNKPDAEALKYLTAFSFASALGTMPSEVNTIVKNAINDAKRDASTKEGGKTKEELDMEEQDEADLEERKTEAKEERNQKAEAIDEILDNENYLDADQIREMKKMRDEYLMTDEEMKEYRKERKGEAKSEKQELKKLLGEYENKSDMKKYNPDLYERTFGEGSDYYKKNRAKFEAEKILRDYLRKKKDLEFNYTPKKKGKKSWGVGSGWGVDSEWGVDNEKKKENKWGVNNDWGANNEWGVQ